MAGPCVPVHSSLTALTVAMSIHCPSVKHPSLAVSASQRHPAYLSKAPAELAADPAVAIQTEGSNHKQQHQQPPRHPA